MTLGGFEFRVLRTDRRRIDSLRVDAAARRRAPQALRADWMRATARRDRRAAAAGAAGRRVAAAGLCAVRPLAAGDPLARAADARCGRTRRRGARPGSASCFGAGTFGAGTWWLYISIHGFGEAPVWLTIALIVALVAIMARLPGAARLPRGAPAAGRWRGALADRAAGPVAAGRMVARLVPLGLPVAVARLQSQTDTPLAALAPVGGVYGCSARCWRSRPGHWLALAARRSCRAHCGAGRAGRALGRGARAAARGLDAG